MRLSKFIVTALVSQGIFSSSLLADDTIDDILVTAMRTPTPVDQITSAVTIVTKADLEALQITKVADYLKTLPGVALASSGSVGGTTQLRMRGAEANQILVLVDGVEMNDPAAGDEFQFEHLSVAGIERIEIIRSPMSATWGSDALAGVVNIVTTGAADGLMGHISGEYGSFDSKRLSGRIAMGGDSWQYALSLNHDRSDGINVSRTGSEKDGYKNTTLNLNGAIDINENLRVQATLRHTDATADFDGVDWLTGLPGDTDNQNDTKKTAASFGFLGSFMDGVYRPSLRFTLLDTDIESLAFGSVSGTTGARKKGMYFDHSFQLSDHHQLTLAVDHEETDFTQTGAASPWGDPNQQQSQKVTGYLADYVGAVTETVSFSASLRRDKNNQFKDVTSWRAGIRAKLSPSFRVFASTAKGHKAPTFIERFGYFADQFLGNPNVKPEHSLTHEMGLEYKGDQTALTAVIFQSNLRDEIDGFSFDPVSFLFTAINKSGKSKRRGFELTLDQNISDHVALSAHYSYVKSTELDATSNRVAELRRPKNSGAVRLTARISEAFNMAFSASYTGKAADLFFPPWPEPQQRVTLSDYILLRVSADYKITDNLVFYGRAENALDKTYEDVYGFQTKGAALYSGIKFIF